jgi:hypothetical protein
MLKFRVWIRSVPGFYEQYDGRVDVYAESYEEAGPRALRELKRTSFPERNASMWRIERIELLQEGR